jgi:hypothetical protein
MEPALWIGPVIVAAAISSLVTVIGWFVSHQTERRSDAARRQEKIRDVQTALLAEIAGNRAQFAEIDLDAHAAEVQARLLQEPDYTPLVPRDAGALVFDAVLADISVLPGETISPVVAYYKQVARIAHFVEDLKGERFVRLPRELKFEMYLDYLGMIRKALRQAQAAEQALAASLSKDRASSPASGPNSPSRSASASASAAGASQSPPSTI